MLRLLLAEEAQDRSCLLDLWARLGLAPKREAAAAE
jgi:hypothetical protein